MALEKISCGSLGLQAVVPGHQQVTNGRLTSCLCRAATSGLEGADHWAGDHLPNLCHCKLLLCRGSERGGGILRDLKWSELQTRGWRHKGSIAVAIQASYMGSQGQWGLRWNISGQRWLRLLLFLCFGDLQAHLSVGIKE